MFGRKAISKSQWESSVIDDWDAYLFEVKRIFDSTYGVPAKPDYNYTIEDFEYIQTLFVGSLVRVVLVRLKKDHRYYVLKILKKEKVVKRHAVQCVMSQKKVMEALSPLRFPFITFLKCAFKDNSYIYFCEPYFSGGALMTHLRGMKRFQERTCMYFAAQVVLVIEFFHNLGLVFRGIKTDNFCLDERGYLKLIHTDFCKRLEGGRTYTICGSPEYIAPEMLSNRGYGKSVDWWCLGILVYELNFGQTPFYGEDNLAVLERIEAADYTMPGRCSEQLRSFIRGLLQRDLSRRLGMLKDGVSDIKNHPWFQGLDWLALLNRRTVLPFRPEVLGPGDTVYVQRHSETQLETSDLNEYDEFFSGF